MARETAAEKQMRIALTFMPSIVEATKNESFLFTDFLVHSPLQLAGLVEINEEIKNENGEVATRATTKGMEQFMENSNEITPVASAIKFAVLNVALPKVTRSSNRKSQYPFDTLEVGQSFFVPATEACKDPAKTMTSSTNAAMRKYDVPDLDDNGEQKTKVITVPRTGEKRTIPKMKHTRVFKIVAIADGADYGQPGVSGAAVGRTA